MVIEFQTTTIPSEAIRQIARDADLRVFEKTPKGLQRLEDGVPRLSTGFLWVELEYARDFYAFAKHMDISIEMTETGTVLKVKPPHEDHP